MCPFDEDCCDYLKAHQNKPRLSPHLKILNLIMSTKSLLPYNVIFIGYRDLGQGHSWAIIHATIPPNYYYINLRNTKRNG